MAVIEAHEATIQTATVEIRTLTVTGKQVTLAVFRQLKAERIEDHAGRLLGEVWGVVNYHPDKCADSGRHLHVVWQLGDELRRARVEPPGRPRERFDVGRYGEWARWVEGGTEWADIAILDGWRTQKLETERDGTKVIFVRFDRGVVGIHLSEAATTILAAERELQGAGDCTEEWAQNHAAGLRARVAAAQTKIRARYPEGVPSHVDLTRWAEEELAEQDVLYARQQANWECFSALPQLFIAV